MATSGPEPTLGMATMTFPQPPVEAVLVDLDGTLADSLPALLRAYEDFLAEHGRLPRDEEFD